MLQDGLLRDEVLTVADAVAAVATATGVTVPVSTTATTRECSMKTSVTDAMETRRERIGKGKKEGAVLGRPLIYAPTVDRDGRRAVPRVVVTVRALVSLAMAVRAMNYMYYMYCTTPLETPPPSPHLRNFPNRSYGVCTANRDATAARRPHTSSAVCCAGLRTLFNDGSPLLAAALGGCPSHGR